MSTTHALKCDPEPFAALWCGDKTCEVRRDDRSYGSFEAGDHLELQEHDRSAGTLGGLGVYTGRRITASVTHVQRGYGLPADMVVMSLRVLRRWQ